MALSNTIPKRPLDQVKQPKVSVPKLSLRTKLALRVRGYARLGFLSDYAHGIFVDDYIGRCKIHGIYYDRVHAQSDIEIRCPKCEDKFLLERMYESWQAANV